MTGVKAMPWSNRPNVILRKYLPLLHIFYHEQRPPKETAVLFVSTRARTYGPEGFLRCPDGGNHRLEFIGLQREGAVRPWHLPRESEMLLHDASSQRHGRNRHCDPEGVIRDPDGNGEFSRKV